MQPINEKAYVNPPLYFTPENEDEEFFSLSGIEENDEFHDLSFSNEEDLEDFGGYSNFDPLKTIREAKPVDTRYDDFQVETIRCVLPTAGKYTAILGGTLASCNAEKTLHKELKTLLSQELVGMEARLRSFFAVHSGPKVEPRTGCLMRIVRTIDSVIAAVCSFFYKAGLAIGLIKEQKSLQPVIESIHQTEILITNQQIRKYIENIPFIATVTRQAPFIGKKISDMLSSLLIDHLLLVFFRENVFGEKNKENTSRVYDKILDRIIARLGNEMKTINDMYDNTSIIGFFTNEIKKKKSSTEIQNELLNKLQPHPAVPLLTLEEEQILSNKQDLVRQYESIDKSILRCQKTAVDDITKAETIKKLEILRKVEAKIAKAEADYLNETFTLLFDYILLPTKIFSSSRNLASRITGMNLGNMIPSLIDYGFKWPDIYAALNEGIKKYFHPKKTMGNDSKKDFEPSRENDLTNLLSDCTLFPNGIFGSIEAIIKFFTKNKQPSDNKKSNFRLERYVGDSLDPNTYTRKGPLSHIEKIITEKDFLFCSLNTKLNETKALFKAVFLSNSINENEKIEALPVNGKEKNKKILVKYGHDIIDNMVADKLSAIRATSANPLFYLSENQGADTLKDIFDTLVERLDTPRVYKHLIFSLVEEVISVLKEEAKIIE